MFARQWIDRLSILVMRRWFGLLLVIGLVLALYIAAARLFHAQWTQVDVQQWNRWIPSNAPAASPSVQQGDKPVAYQDVRYRIERPYEYGGANGIVSIRTTYESEIDLLPSVNPSNGWWWRVVWILRQGPFKASSWQDLRLLPMLSYRTQQTTYEYICPSQEFRHLRSLYENDLGMRGTETLLYNHSSEGWTQGLDQWSESVNKGEPMALKEPAPIWSELCRHENFPPVEHFSFELYQQREAAVREGKHRIWIPFPPEIKDPSALDSGISPWPMQVCAQETTSAKLTCRLWITGDDTQRHALLVEPGTYRFFQQFYCNFPKQYLEHSPCQNTTRWFWRTHTRGPIEVRLRDLGPGTSVGPQIAFFDVEGIEDTMTWAWPAPGRHAVPALKVMSEDSGLSIPGKPGDPIMASADGYVWHLGTGPSGQGLVIIIKHGDHYATSYAHLQTQLVSQGQSVRKGQKIATMGSTGTDRVHLNFEIRRNDRRVNPALYLRGL